MCNQSNVVTNTVSYWKLDELADIIDFFENVIAEKVNQGMQTAWDYDNLMVFAASKTIVTAREILCLAKAGYPNGAFSLVRNLYEQLIALLFLHAHKASPDFLDYVEDYHLDFDWRQNKYLLFCAEKFTKDTVELAKLKAERDRIKAKAQHTVEGDYWWAGYGSFNKLAMATIDLESDPTMHNFLNTLHMRYKEACTLLHASSLGNQYSIGVAPDYFGVDTSPKPNALGHPLLFFVETIMGIIAIISEDFGLKILSGQRPLKERLVDLERYYYSVL